MNQLLLYLGNELIGDINMYAKNRSLSETLKSETESQNADCFTFSINWRAFQNFIDKRSPEPATNFLKIGKTRIVFVTDGYVRFAGYLAARPAREGIGSAQELQLTFYEYFARLSGDLVCNPNNKLDPYWRFENVPAHQYVKSLIDMFIAHAAEAGETINWRYGHVDELREKTYTYKDFQTIAHALCNAMNNVEGAGKFDVVVKADPVDYTKQIVDILKPRGDRKNIRITFPSDGVYKLWANNFSVDETNEYASEVLVAGNGQVGDVAEGEQTAVLGVASDPDRVAEHCYWREYSTQSSIVLQKTIDEKAATRLKNRAFDRETPEIELIGRPIEWGNAENYDNGLALGDSFYFDETTDDLSDTSGWYRIVAMDTSWDDNGVATVRPKLQAVTE